MLLFYSCKDDPFEADSGTFTDSRDNHEYKWVKIGEQIWMAENLAYAPYLCAPDSQCGIWIYDYYGEGSYGTNYHIYGCLYDWETALEVCPNGWHLSSDEEWMELERYLGMAEDQIDRTGIVRGEEANVGGKLKEIGNTHWIEPNEGATNETGFTALPGSLLYEERFTSTGGSAYYWTSSLKNEESAIHRMLPYYHNSIFREPFSITFGLSVRCIKN
ncbi:MAG: hypothetical protein HQ541_03570 [Mariniphaga sp.]|nr:hypothetical protein [Mariniphaga sp.]